MGEKRLNRRGFLTAAGASAVGAAAAVGAKGATSAQAETAEVLEATEAAKVTLNINGRQHRLVVEARWSLLHVLREELGITGAKQGCGRGECGGCTVLLDGVPHYACMTLALEAEGREITTVEGLMEGEDLGPVQQAFVNHDAYQCGYCTPGQIMAVEGLLRANADPSVEEVRIGVSGNLCRCGAYANIFKAAQEAARLKKGGRR
ncbi:MAG TPA: (2Fe-2S)-binding protein [Acidobacteriota bacterium]|nr:(2Fe-2S)-binding protein [Acidobacteriota bacterium]